MHDTCKTCKYADIKVSKYPCNTCCFRDPKAVSNYRPAENRNPLSLGEK